MDFADEAFVLSARAQGDTGAVVDLLMARAPGAQITAEHLPEYLGKRRPLSMTAPGAATRGEARGRWLRQFLTEHEADLDARASA